MTLVLENGNYVPNGKGGVLRAEGAQALLAEALFRLTCRKGAFPFLPQLGSRLYTLGKEKPSARAMAARQYAAEALEGLNLTVQDVKVTAAEGDKLLLAVYLKAGKDTVLAEVKV